MKLLLLFSINVVAETTTHKLSTLQAGGMTVTSIF